MSLHISFNSISTIKFNKIVSRHNIILYNNIIVYIYTVVTIYYFSILVI